MEQIEIRVAPVDQNITEIIDKLLESLPEYADGFAYIDYEEIWRTVRKSKKENYYSKRNWKPLFGWNYILLSRKLIKYIGYLSFRYCEACAFLITKEKRIYIASVYQPEKNIYIFYPKAEIRFYTASL